jgi:hypothetical protein
MRLSIADWALMNEELIASMLGCRKERGEREGGRGRERENQINPTKHH